MKTEAYKDGFKPLAKKMKLNKKSVIYLDLTTEETLGLIEDLVRAVRQIQHKDQPKVALNYTTSIDKAVACRFSFIINKVL